MTKPTDMQSLFEAGAGNNDFLSAGKVEETTGLCLSGGGYRAMLYHAGALRALNEHGLLPSLAEIASVSGGSITAGALACAWPKLLFASDDRATNFEGEFVDRVISMAGQAIDIKASLIALLPGRTAADAIASAYDRYLFDGASLQDLPDFPRFT
ncbi:MAG: patatin-like phospholipase family protein, partial [Hyphomicrobium sp.]